MLRRTLKNLLLSLLCGLTLASTASAQLTITPTLRRTVANTWTAVQTFSSGIIGTPIIGGTTTTSDLVLQTTSGVGASGADMHFLVGNNGATEAMTILNSGFVGVNQPSPAVRFDVGGTGRFVTTLASAGYQSGISLTDLATTTLGFGLQNPSSTSLPFVYGNSGLGFGSSSAEYMRLISTGNFGFRTTAPDKAVEINSATGVNLRLTYNDSNGSAANYTDFSTTSTGDLTIAPAGTNPMFIVGSTTSPKFVAQSKAYSMADNVAVGLFTVDLPTADTGCAAHVSFMYTATDSASDTVSHAGIAVVSITNDDTVIAGSAADSGESVMGVGCNAGCDSWTVTNPSGTTAQVNATFNNTLTGSPAGSLTYNILNTTCTTFARL